MPSGQGPYAYELWTYDSALLTSNDIIQANSIASASPTKAIVGLAPNPRRPAFRLHNNRNYMNPVFDRWGRMVAQVAPGSPDAHSMYWAYRENSVWDSRRQINDNFEYECQFTINIMPDLKGTNQWAVVYQLLGNGQGPIIALEYATTNKFANPPGQHVWQVKIRGNPNGHKDTNGFVKQVSFVTPATFYIRQKVHTDPKSAYSVIALNGKRIAVQTGKANNYRNGNRRFSGFGFGVYSNTIQKGNRATLPLAANFVRIRINEIR